MLTLHTLASSSSGNSILVSDGRTHILVDAGISCSRIRKSLAGLGLRPNQLSGLLITHEHHDHISGLEVFARDQSFPVCATAATGGWLCSHIPFLESRFHALEPGRAFSLGTIRIRAFRTSHDAADSVGYRFSSGNTVAAVATDLGDVTQEVLDGVLGAQILIVEANHDLEMLQDGSYPVALKRRILGENGHLSNDAGAELACQAARAGARIIALAHLSAENNTPELAFQTVAHALERSGFIVGQDVQLSVAPRSEPGPALTWGE